MPGRCTFLDFCNVQHCEQVVGSGYTAHAFALLMRHAVCCALCRLQQLQGKPVVVPPGAPAAMADTSKVLGLIEGLTATAPSAGTPNTIPAPSAVPAARAASAASAAAGATRVTAAGGKGAPAVPAMSKAEQVGAGLGAMLEPSRVGFVHPAACVCGLSQTAPQ
jgi:hypothetical protein